MESPMRSRTTSPTLFRSVTLSLLVFGGCGSSATDPRPDGSTVTAAGATVTSPDGRATLILPPGAVTEPVAIRIVASNAQSADPRVVPGSTFRFEPSGLQFQVPAQLTLSYGELPTDLAGSAPFVSLHRYTSGEWVPVHGATADTVTRVLSASLTGFSDYGAVISDLASDLQELNTTLNRLLGDPVAADAIRLMSLVGGLLMRVDHPLFDRLVEPVIEAMILTACNARNLAVDLAHGSVVRTYESLTDQLRPVYYWTAILVKLDADDRCPPRISVAELQLRKLTEFIDFFIERLGQPDLTTEFAKLLDEARLLMKLRSDASLLDLDEVNDRLREEAQLPLLQKLRESGYAACRNDAVHRHLGFLRAELPTLDAVPYDEDDLLEDLQFCATRINWKVQDQENAVIGSGKLGGGDSIGTVALEAASPAVARGTLELAGDLRAFRCMDGSLASDDLIVTFAGAEIRRSQAAGDGNFLTSPLGFDLEALLAAADLDPADRGPHRLVVARTTSGCGNSYIKVRFEPVVLAAIDLTFALDWSYSEDFESGMAGPEWSNRQVAISPSGQRFLGRLTNGAVTLTLTDLPAHNEATVALDLYLIRSWDGNNPDSGPDIVEFSLGDALLKRTTFSNVHRLDDPHPQAFPGDYPGDSYPAATGASGINTLGYPPGSNRHGDTKYRLEFTAASSSTTLTFTVTASNLQALDDESWGIDNVEVKLR
jgi:hypothetical protein